MRKLFGWIGRNVFGFHPGRIKAEWWNSVLLLGGAILLADTLHHFVGIVLVGEAFLITIEQSWDKEIRP